MSPTEPSPRTVRLLTAVLLVATFAAGTVTGAGVCHWVTAQQGPPPPPPPPGGPLPLDQLGLSPGQQDQIHRIMERHRPELDAVLRDTFPRVRGINEQLEREVREVLTPAQRQKLDDLEARRPPPPPGPPPGPPPPWGPPPGNPAPSVGQ